MGIIKLILTYIMCLSQILAPLQITLTPGGEASYFTQWSVNDTFDAADYIELEKQEGEDFVILNLADVQLSDAKAYGELGECSEDLITKLIADNDPDLITLSGDNAWDTAAYMRLIEFLDSFDIPWAPVMGNHDGQGCISEFWVAYNLIQAENCLFQFGPEDMGYGNYIINITENGKFVHTLFMMDTHDHGRFVLEDGTIVEDYDHLWNNQQEWYKWAVNGIAEMAGRTVESTVIMHIPVREYIDAWESVCIEAEGYEFGIIDPKYSDIAAGRRFEYGGPSPINNGFFSLCKELGSTKIMLVGHDHVNDYYVEYEGITLSYAVKSGFGSYWQPDMIGGTTLTVNSAGNVDLEQHYYDLAANGWNIEP